MTALDGVAIPSILRSERGIDREPLFFFVSRCFPIYLIDHVFPLFRSHDSFGGQLRAFRPVKVDPI